MKSVVIAKVVCSFLFWPCKTNKNVARVGKKQEIAENQFMHNNTEIICHQTSGTYCKWFVKRAHLCTFISLFGYVVAGVLANTALRNLMSQDKLSFNDKYFILSVYLIIIFANLPQLVTHAISMMMVISSSNKGLKQLGHPHPVRSSIIRGIILAACSLCVQEAVMIISIKVGMKIYFDNSANFVVAAVVAIVAYLLTEIILLCTHGKLFKNTTKYCNKNGADPGVNGMSEQD